MLRSPEFGNRFKVHLNVITHRDLGGSIRQFSTNLYPKFESMEVTFRHLDMDKINEFVDYIESTAGEEIEIEDHEQRIWLGVVTSPEIQIVKGRTGCNHSVSFTFEGLLQ
jgi:hypothetical protein